MGFDAILASPAGPGFLADTVRLYRVVLGRRADPGGVRSTVEQMALGVPLHALAAAMLASDEFARQHGPADAVLRRNTLGSTGASAPDAGMPGELAAALVRSPEVVARVPVLPELFPDGLLLHDPSDYRIWLAGRPDPHPAPDDMPPVSFVVPAAAPDVPGLEQTVRSVLALGWPGLEVLVPVAEAGPALRALAASDGRIRLLPSRWRRAPHRLANRGLAHAAGVFATFLAPGDLLDARAGVAAAAALPQADVVLTDEDGLDENGLRHDPRFGDAWDPDRALAAGRPGLVLARTALLRQAGGMVQGGTAWDLLLRLSLLAGPARIVHVPALVVSRPAATLPADRVRRAQRHLRAAGQPGATALPDGAGVRAAYSLPASLPRASVIIATRNRAELLGPCVEGVLRRTEYADIEVVLVDNGSDAPDALALLDRQARDHRVRVLRQPGPFNWAALNNAGVAASTGEVCVLLNNDTDVIDAGWLHELVAQAMRPGVGAVGAKLLYPDGTVQHAGVVLGRDGHAIHMWRRNPGDAPGYLRSLTTVREVSAVTGACLAMRRTVFDSLGGCDAANLPVTWNDIDLCLRVRAQGLRVIWTPHARLLHLEQASRGADDTPENDARFRREQAFMRARWGDALVRDPFLNPNLLPSETVLRLAARLA